MANHTLIDVSIRGLRDARGRFAKTPETITNAQIEELSGTLREVLALYREAAPKNKRSDSSRNSKRPDEGAHGLFSESFDGMVLPEGYTVNVEISTSQPLLRTFLKDGTAPHEIPKGGAMAGKTLAFHVDGDMVFARSVHHPGTKPNRWEDPVEPAAADLLREAGNRIGHRVVRSLVGE